jgi:hypothetical protein
MKKEVEILPQFSPQQQDSRGRLDSLPHWRWSLAAKENPTLAAVVARAAGDSATKKSVSTPQGTSCQGFSSLLSLEDEEEQSRWRRKSKR